MASCVCVSVLMYETMTMSWTRPYDNEMENKLEGAYSLDVNRTFHINL